METEFLNKNDGRVVVITDKENTTLTENDVELVNSYFDRIQNEFPDAYKSLDKLYHNFKPLQRRFRFKVVNRFLQCNFGRYDTAEYDIDKDNNWHFEKTDCPIRGDCPLENIVCFPKMKSCLSLREIEVINLAVEGHNSEEIAEILHISTHTVHNHVTNILDKMNVHSMKYVYKWYITNNKTLNNDKRSGNQ
jgi:DNA-binding CsgD family transcriptional regulator